MSPIWRGRSSSRLKNTKRSAVNVVKRRRNRRPQQCRSRSRPTCGSGHRQRHGCGEWTQIDGSSRQSYRRPQGCCCRKGPDSRELPKNLRRVEMIANKRPIESRFLTIVARATRKSVASDNARATDPLNGRSEWIRTTDPQSPRLVRYQAAPRSGPRHIKHLADCPARRQAEFSGRDRNVP